VRSPKRSPDQLEEQKNGQRRREIGNQQHRIDDVDPEDFADEAAEAWVERINTTVWVRPGSPSYL